MIDTDDTFGITTFYCDYNLCDDEFVHEGDNQVDFQKAVDEAKESGWIIKNIDDEWMHFSSVKCYADYLESKGF